MKKWIKITLGLGVAGFVALQVDALADRLPVVRAERHLNRPADMTIEASRSLDAVVNPPEEIRKLIKGACYDCHSSTTAWPWYSYVAPVKWFVIEHVIQGRKHVNFANVSEETEEDLANLFEECAKEIKSGHMPIDSYTWTHDAAKLDDAKKKTLVDWFLAEAAKRKG